MRPRATLAAALGALALAAGCEPEPPRPVTPVVAVRALTVIAFEVVGPGRVDYAGIATAKDGVEQVASNKTHAVADPVMAVLTIRAERGKVAKCRVAVDGALAVEESSADGSSATCLWVNGHEPPARAVGLVFSAGGPAASTATYALAREANGASWEATRVLSMGEHTITGLRVAALAVVPASADELVTCRITVDGDVVAESRSSGLSPALCVWRPELTL